MAEPDQPQMQPAFLPELDGPDFSNGIRLSIRVWLGLALFALVLVLAAPPAWEQVEAFQLESDYRIPYELNNDYWHYARCSRLAAKQYNWVVVGDSVVWGPYVKRSQTLTHYLNEQAHQDQFANLGLAGAHPVALAGLVEHYATAISGKNVLLVWNALWITEPRHDLQDEDETLQHPRLVPQFTEHIPSNKAEMSARIGIVVEQRVPFLTWTQHLQQAYYEQMDIPAWTLKHPYQNPMSPLANGLPPATDEPQNEPVTWLERGIPRNQNFPWLADMESSLQWRSFRRAVEILRSRGNHVFVLLSPYNQHLLSKKSAARYATVTQTVATWMKDNNVPHSAPDLLPEKEYADASHPLSAGYEHLAKELYPRLHSRPAP
jgi:hypothetical protein